MERTREKVAATEVHEVMSDWRRSGAKWRRMKRTGDVFRGLDSY